MNKSKLGTYYEWQDAQSRPSLAQHLINATASLESAKEMLAHNKHGDWETLTEAVNLIDNVMED